MFNSDLNLITDFLLPGKGPEKDTALETAEVQNDLGRLPLLDEDVRLADSQLFGAHHQGALNRITILINRQFDEVGVLLHLANRHWGTRGTKELNLRVPGYVDSIGPRLNHQRRRRYHLHHNGLESSEQRFPIMGRIVIPDAADASFLQS